MPVARCSYELNAKPVSALVCDGQRFTAFSGTGADVNRAEKAGDVDAGPLPPGRYYIVARESMGHLGWLRDWIHSERNGYDVTKWFMLLRDNNGRAQDETFVAGVVRGHFRLHPIGPRGLSEGCITVTDTEQFGRLRSYLLRVPIAYIPGTTTRYFGTVDVR